MKNFPPAVIVTAFATFVAFMGIGVVDPILPLIGQKMGATPSQVEWLFTSYIAVMAFSMLISGVVGTRIGGKRTMMIGLGLVVTFATLSGFSPNLVALAFFRGGWGFGNAFFTSTALSIIVGLSTGGIGQAITLYEAALGLGIASGPLLGGTLGGFSWRYPFFGTAALMAVGFLLTWTMVKEPPRKENARKIKDVFRALGNKPILLNALIGLSYNYGFFTILAYSPLTLPHLPILDLGFTYFFWGLLLAFSSVVVVNMLVRRFNPISVLIANLSLLILVFLFAGAMPGSSLLVIIVITGFFAGIANALFTTLAMQVSSVQRSIASGAYNFVRWAGAAVAPVLDGWIGQTYGLTIPFYVASAIMAAGVLALVVRGKTLRAAIEVHGGAAH